MLKHWIDLFISHIFLAYCSTFNFPVPIPLNTELLPTLDKVTESFVIGPTTFHRKSTIDVVSSTCPLFIKSKLNNN